MARLQVTHFWSLIFAPILWASRLGFAVFFAEISEEVGFDGIWQWINFFGGLFLHVLLLDKFHNTFQTFLYVNLSLRTPINLIDAYYLWPLFSIGINGKWYPMDAIKELPRKKRKAQLLLAAKKIFEKEGVYRKVPKSTLRYINNLPRDKQETIPFPGFKDLVGMLCRVAKADNRISQEEIIVIDRFFTETLKLSPEIKKEAIKIFNKAKASDKSFENYARNFYRYHSKDINLLKGTLILLIELAKSDGTISAEEEILIFLSFKIFNFTDESFKEKSHGNRSSNKTEASLQILGFSDIPSRKDLKTKYRKLATEFHPDKVDHLGDEVKRVAEKKMKEVNDAYEHLMDIAA